MSRVESPKTLRSIIEGRQFLESPLPNLPMVAGYALVAGLVAPGLAEQSADLVAGYLESLSYGPKPDLPELYLPKALAFVAGISGAAIHTTFALVAARRQAIAPPVIQPEGK